MIELGGYCSVTVFDAWMNECIMVPHDDTVEERGWQIDFVFDKEEGASVAVHSYFLFFSIFRRSLHFD